MARMNLAVVEDESSEEVTPARLAGPWAEIPLVNIALDPVTDVRSGQESAESLQEFAARLDLEGLAQPILVRPRPGVPRDSNLYSVIAGRRRLAAFGLLSRGQIPAYVLDVDDETARKLAFEENYRRKQFSPVDLARLFLEARGEKFQPNWSERVSKRFGVSRATVTETIKMYEGLADHPELLAKVGSGELAADAAILIAKNKEQSARVFEEAQKLAVQEAAQRAVKAQKAAKPQEKGKKPASDRKSGKNDTPKEPKPVKVQAKHVKQAARAAGKSTGALNRAEIVDGLLRLVDPSYPAVMNAFLNHAMTAWKDGKSDQQALRQHWLAIACKIEEDMKGCEEAATTFEQFKRTVEAGRLERNAALKVSPEAAAEVVRKTAKKAMQQIRNNVEARIKKAVAKKSVKSKPSQKPRKTAPAKTRKK